MIRNGIGNIRNDAARRQLEVAAGVRREELNNQAAAMGQNMMAQAETLPSGILASSPELQQTAMAMANGGPVQGFKQGGGILSVQQAMDRLVNLGGLPRSTASRLVNLQVGAGNVLPPPVETETPVPEFGGLRFGGDRFGGDRFGAEEFGGATVGGNTPRLPFPGQPGSEELLEDRAIASDARRIGIETDQAARRREQQLSQDRPGFINEMFTTVEKKPELRAERKSIDDQLNLIRSGAFAEAQQAREAEDIDQAAALGTSAPVDFIDTEDRPGVADAMKVFQQKRLAESGTDDEDTFAETKSKASQLGQANEARENPITSTRAQELAEQSRNAPDFVGGDDEDSIPDLDTERDKNPERSIKDTVTSLFKLDSKETGNIILEAVGEKKEEKLEDRIKKYKSIAEDIFGEDIEGEKTERAYNLAFLGFAIAAGDSPNALTNISKGLLSATKKFNDSAEKKRRRKQKIKEFAVSEALKDERDQKKFLRDTALQRDRLANRLEVAGINNTASAKIAAGRTYAQLLINARDIKSAEKIANDRNASADARQEAVNEINRLKLERQGIPKFQLGLATEFKNRMGRDIRPEDYDTKEFDEIKKDYMETFKAFENLRQSAAAAALGTKAQTDRFVTKNLTEIRRLARKQLGLKPGQEPTPEQIRAFAERFITTVKKPKRIPIDETGKPK